MLRIPAGNPSAWTGPEGNNTYLLPGAVPALVDAGVGVPAHLDAVNARWASRRSPGSSSRTPIRITLAVFRRFALAGGGGATNTAGSLPRRRDHCRRRHAARRAAHPRPRARPLLLLRRTDTRPVLRRSRQAQRNDRRPCQQGRQPRGIPRIAAPHSRARAGAAPARPRTDHRGRRGTDRRVPDASCRAGTPGARGAADAGCETIAQLVDRIYSGLHPSVVPAAADSMLAHLIKLRDEGKVVESSDIWRLA